MAPAHFTAIGGFREAVLGYFDRDELRYREIPVDVQAEVLSLAGTVAQGEQKLVVHAHAILGLRDGSTRCGHLLRASVWPTLDVVLIESPRHLRRRRDAETGSPSSATTPDRHEQPGRAASHGGAGGAAKTGRARRCASPRMRWPVALQNLHRPTSRGVRCGPDRHPGGEIARGAGRHRGRRRTCRNGLPTCR